MPTKPNNQQKALQQRLAANLAKYADDNARRAAILKKNAHSPSIIDSALA
jgi:hypothetical protein